MVCEESRVARAVGEEKKGYDTPGCGYRAEDYEDVLPFLQAGVDVPYGIADEPAEHGCDADGGVVCFQTKRLFVGCVPHGHEEHETGVDGAFEGPKEEAVGCHASEVRACGGSNEDDAPADYGG